MNTDDLQHTIEKYKIWNTETNSWYRPTYPKNKVINTEEILFSQSGEMWMRTNDGTPGSCDVLTHLNGKFKPCLYTGLKDVDEKKTYEYDVVMTDDGPCLVVFKNGSAYAELLSDRSRSFILGQLKAFSNMGSSIEFPELLEA
jgi:hypothetical protein